MKIELDTEYIEETLTLTFSEAERKQDLTGIIQEFCFGLASLFIDFSQKLNLDEKQAQGLKEVCLDVTGRDIDAMIKSILQPKDSEGEMQELIEKMIDSGFSNGDIQNCLKIVENCGSLENAVQYLKSVGKEHGIQFD